MAASAAIARAGGRKTPAAIRAASKTTAVTAAKTTRPEPFITPSKTLKRTLLDPTLTKTLKSVRYPITNGKPIQGKLRHPMSQAAKNWRRAESERLKRALQSLTHGRDIFAYRHMRTNQVVYSLSRTLEERNVLSQLIYHGKKTVPASLRKDMWVPYFSVHFCDSETQLGLLAYQLLRQFSLKRQLSPPPEMITHTEETIARYKPRDPTELEEWEKTWKPRIGQFMQKRERARVLMDQKATSVADLAATLQIVRETRAKRLIEAASLLEREKEKEKKLKENQNEKQEKGAQPKKKERNKLSIKARKRLRRQRAREELHRQEVAKKIAMLEKEISRLERVQVKIDRVPELTGKPITTGRVRVLWKDASDAQYAQSWPRTVEHAELEHMREHFFTHLVKPERVEEEIEFEEPVAAETSAEVAKPEKKRKKSSKKSGLDKLKFWKN